MHAIVKKQDLLLKNLNSFYTKDENINLLHQLLNKQHVISLRVIDYLCTKFSKKHNVMYQLDDRSLFNIHLSYRAQLKAYSKLTFDPFRRHARITIPCSLAQDSKIQTTVAQLNFFKWAIENKIIQWLNENLLMVESEMMVNNTRSIKK